MTIDTYLNQELNITSFVTPRDAGGYAVTVRDNDSGLYVGIVKIFKTIKPAKAFAKKCIK